jgi:hypothetical protein
LRSRRHADGVLLVDVELEPCAPGRDDPAGGEQLVEGLVGLLLEDDARRADQLAGHDPLGAVDDEGALVGHDREVAHEDRLGLDLAGGAVLELGLDVELAGEGVVSLPALLNGVLGLLEAVLPEGERHLAGEVLDGADLVEGLRRPSVISHSKDWRWMAMRSGMGRISGILPKESREEAEVRGSLNRRPSPFAGSRCGELRWMRRRLGTPKPGVGWSKAREDMRRSSVALSYTAVNVELRVCVGTSLRLVRPSLPPTPGSVKGQLRRVGGMNALGDGGRRGPATADR